MMAIFYKEKQNVKNTMADWQFAISWWYYKNQLKTITPLTLGKENWNLIVNDVQAQP